MTNLEESETYCKYKNGFILEGYRGSQAHGTHISNNPDSIDDIDLMSIYVSPIEYYCGLKYFEVQEIKYNEWDVVIYDIKKFISLLLKQNPNVCSLLWLEDKFYTKLSKIGKELIDNRDIFVSKKAFNSFSGYAYSQFKRMTHYQAYEGYMGEKRKKLVDKFGYDVKNAAHLIRLLEMCIEYLETGKFIVLRPNFKTLIDIKLGKWSLDSVQKYANELFEKSELAFKKSKLPEEPEYDRANKLLVEIILKYNKLK